MAGGLLAAPLAAEGQQAKKVWRIGYLTGGSAEREKSWLASFRQGLRELGYVKGEGDRPPMSLRSKVFEFLVRLAPSVTIGHVWASSPTWLPRRRGSSGTWCHLE